MLVTQQRVLKIGLEFFSARVLAFEGSRAYEMPVLPALNMAVSTLPLGVQAARLFRIFVLLSLHVFVLH